MKKKYARSLVEHAEFHITTLFDCRKHEKHPDGIADRLEGTKEIRCVDPDIDSRNPDTPPSLLRSLGIAAVDDTSTFISHNSVFDIKQESPDCYLFCLTRDCNPEPWRDKFAYDTCVQVSEPELFFQALTNCVFQKVRIEEAAFMADCVYLSRSQNIRKLQHLNGSESIPPMLIKDPSFAYQQEVRAIWIPKQQPIAPFPIKCTQAATLCSIIP